MLTTVFTLNTAAMPMFKKFGHVHKHGSFTTVTVIQL